MIVLARFLRVTVSGVEGLSLVVTKILFPKNRQGLDIWNAYALFLRGLSEAYGFSGFEGSLQVRREDVGKAVA